jgi:hypothetical protein
MFHETRACGPRSLNVILGGGGEGQGYSDHIKFPIVNIIPFHLSFITDEHTHSLGQRSLEVLFERSRSLSACILFEGKQFLFLQF